MTLYVVVCVPDLDGTRHDNRRPEETQPVVVAETDLRVFLRIGISTHPPPPLKIAPPSLVLTCALWGISKERRCAVAAYSTGHWLDRPDLKVAV